jgi:ribosomal protein S18 acetylase RimI-like enzyme
MTREFQIRELNGEDARRVAELNAQLGYVADEIAIRERLTRLASESAHTVLGAEGPDGIVGFVHFFERPSIEKGFDLVVQSLVTGQAQRGRGLGRILMNEVEKAARSKGIGSVVLSSRTDREAAHAFYGRLGYEVVATSNVFSKKLK